MEIKENVIKDLLPLYFADEVSEDTKLLVEEYLKHNPDIVKNYKQVEDNILKTIPASLNKDDQLQAFLKVKRWQMIRTIILSVILSVGFLLLLSFIVLIFKVF